MTLGVGGILSAEPADIVRRLTFATKEAALPEHRDLFDAMARLNLAHVVMLADRRLVRPDVYKPLAKLLLDILQGGPSTVALHPEGGDLYPQIEAHVAKVLGPQIAGYLQLGRSRGDVIPAAMRGKLRTKEVRLLAAILELRRTLLEVASQHVTTVMPAYTHWQQSQVMTLGHFLGRFAAWFERDFERLLACVQRHNLSPLGAANGVGTSVALDRVATSELLGHDHPILSAGDAVYASDYMVEPVSDAALFCSHASRLAGNFLLWHTREFGVTSLSDAFATASTYLPHKKNPEPLETVRVFAEMVAGDLNTVHIMARNEDWPHSLINHGFPAINRALDMSVDTAQLMAACLVDLRFDTKRMAELAATSFATASEVANVLVRECDLPFREAHEIVGRGVRYALEAGRRSLAAEDLYRAAREITSKPLAISDERIAEASDPLTFIALMNSPGGVNAEETQSLLAHWNRGVTQDERRLAEMQQNLNAADARLVARAQALIGA